MMWMEIGMGWCVWVIVVGGVMCVVVVGGVYV